MPDVDAALATIGQALGSPPVASQDAEPSAASGAPVDVALNSLMRALNASPDELKAMAQPAAVNHTLGRTARNLFVAGAPQAVTGLAGLPADLAGAAWAASSMKPATNLPLGLPSVDPMTGMPNPDIGSATPEIPNLPGGSQSLNNLIGKVGLGPSANPAEDFQDRLEQGIGANVTGALMPFGLARSGALGAGNVARVLGAGPKNLALATGEQALIGAGAGAGGAVAEEAAPEGLKPLAGFAGQLVGGGGMSGGMAAAQAAGRYGIVKPWQYFRQPSQVAKEVSGDLASGAIPAAPPGTPAEVGDLFKQQLDTADQLAQSHMDALKEQSQARIEGLKGQQQRQNEAADAYTASLRQQSQEAATGLAPSGTPQEIGQGMRGLVAQTNKVAKTRESDLWTAIDPDKTLGVSTADTRSQIADIEKGIPSTAKPPAGEERAVLDTISALPDQMPFHDFGALWSRVQAAIRQERMVGGGETPEVRRLGQIRSALGETLQKSVQQAAEADPALATRLAEHGGTYSEVKVPFEADLARSYRSSPQILKTATASSDPLVQSVLRVGDTGYDPTTGAAFSRSSGGVGQGAGRSGNIPGGPQVPAGEQPLKPFDQAAADRYSAAKAATLERKQTYVSGPAGKVLAPGPNGTPYRMPESRVAPTFTSSPEGVQAFIKAAGDRPAALGMVQDQLASTLPRKDGVVDVARYPRWLEAQRKAGLFNEGAFPELEARFATAADAEKLAQGAENAATAERAAQQRELQQTTAAEAKGLQHAERQQLAEKKQRDNSAAALFIGREPIEAVRKAIRSEGKLKELVQDVKGHDRAEMGLKRAITQHIREISGGEQGSVIRNSSVSKFIDKYRSDLNGLFSDAHLDSIKKIIAKFQKPVGEVHGMGDVVTAIMAERASEMLHSGHAAVHVGWLHHVAGALGPLLAVFGKHALTNMRARGIHSLDQLMDEAMLNPQLARTLSEKLTSQNGPDLLARFGNQLAAVTAEAPQNQRDTTDAVTRAVSAMAPGEAITIQRLKSLSGLSDITDLRKQMLSRGLIKEQNGRYIRAETVNSGDALAKQPKGVVANPTILDRVHKAIQQRAPTLRRQSLSDLSGEIESRPSPYYGSYRPGGLVEHTAAVGQGTPLTHDVVHLLRRSGAIPREEWSVLSNKADDWAKKLGVEGPRGIRQEEAVARAFNHWKAGDMQLPPGLRRIMGGITAVAERASA